ncbi:hypothetical protein RRG08_004562 [Elysia crispata]|uniref:Uncharacterized protein n=1 Tax=Elysia crispata TaxID=231223 RepID=A0AAE1AL11_9GAST|nr:hypothetical protein RRG08_004562 [Elysia crispata]
MKFFKSDIEFETSQIANIVCSNVVSRLHSACCKRFEELCCYMLASLESEQTAKLHLQPFVKANQQCLDQRTLILALTSETVDKSSVNKLVSSRSTVQTRRYRAQPRL